MSKNTFYIGNAIYTSLFILAILFYVERTAFVDISFHLFYILKDEYFAIQNFRFGSVFTQAFPLFAYYLSLPLKYIMLTYSVGFALIYWIHFNIQFRLGYKFGLVMLMLSILMVNDTFYWIQSELPQGLAMLTLLLAYISFSYERHKKPFLFYPIFTLLTFTTAFMHPLLLFPFLFGVTFLFFKQEIGWNLFLGSVVSYLGFFGIKTFFFATAYDSQSMGGASNIFTLFPHYFTLESNVEFLGYLLYDYYLLLIGLISVSVYYIYKRKTLLFLSVLLFFIGYSLLVNISYPQGGAKFYMENLYLPLTIFVAYPLAFDLLPALKGKYFLGILLLAGIIRLTHIYYTSAPYTERANYLLELIEETPEGKMVRSATEAEKEILQMDWATPYEIWLLSTIKTGRTKSMVIIDNPEKLEWAKSQNKSFITKWGAFDYETLPDRYFNFTDSSQYVFE